MLKTSSAVVEPDARREPHYDWSLNGHIHPMDALKGYAGHLVDKQGRDFIDLHSASGANLLGYGYRCVTRAIKSQARRFTNLGLPSPEFWELMGLLREIIPGAERIRYGKNGSDVTAGAVRLARAITRRELVMHYGYHGFQDWWMASTPCQGIPQSLRPLIVTLPALTPEAVADAFRRHPDEFACLILDPMVPPWTASEVIREIIEIVHRHGALAIFDELVSGFRVAPGGAQEVWGVTPDLCCFGKSIANGMPLSVLAGSERHMNHLPETFYGMTFEGEAVSLAAALATVREVRKRKVCAALAEKGRTLKQAYAAQAGEYGIQTKLIGTDVRPYLWMEDQGGIDRRALRWLCLQELARAKVLTQGSLTLCYSHNARDLRHVAEAFAGALRTLRGALDRGTVKGLLDERILAGLA